MTHYYKHLFIDLIKIYLDFPYACITPNCIQNIYYLQN